MTKIVIRQSEFVSNPLLDLDIVIINNDSTKEEVELLKSNKDMIVVPLYVLSHSGRSFSIVPFSDTWDSSQYGVLGIPNEYICDSAGKLLPESNKTIQSYVKLYEEWAEGNIYDIGFSSLPFKEFDTLSDCLLENIDFNELLELENIDIINFMKENKINKSIAQDLDINHDRLFKDFRSLFIGRSNGQLITAGEIVGWSNENYGYNETLEEAKKVSPIVEAYIKYIQSPWFTEEIDFDFENLITQEPLGAIKSLRRADIRAFHAEEAACGNI